MFLLLKLVVLVFYALAIASVLGMLPDSWNIIVAVMAIILAIHAIEAVIMFKHVRRYRGSLAMSISLTMLFGFLHLKPLADSAKNEAA